MKLLLAGLTLVILSTTANASYLERCVFEAEVKTITTLAKLGGSVQETKLVALVEVKKVISGAGSHVPSACQRHLDNDLKVLEVSPKHKLVVNSRIKLDYFYVNSRGPVGVRHSTRYTLAE